MTVVVPEQEYYEPISKNLYICLVLESELDLSRYGLKEAHTTLPLCPSQVFLNVRGDRKVDTGTYQHRWSDHVISFGQKASDEIILRKNLDEQFVFDLGFTGMQLVQLDGMWHLQLYNINRKDLFGQVQFLYKLP